MMGECKTNSPSWFYIIVLILLLPLLVSCTGSQKRFTNDAYQIEIKIFSDNSCELSINGQSFVYRKASWVRFQQPFLRALDQQWDCGGMDEGNKYHNGVSIISPSCFCEYVVITEPLIIVQKENVNIRPDVSLKWQVHIGGQAVEAKIRPPLRFSFFTNFRLEMYEINLVLDPQSEVMVKLSGLARRDDASPGL